MDDFIRISLETHLFFARIMKEHALFLQAGFVGKDVSWIQKASSLREAFEDLLRQTVKISNRAVSCSVLDSEELVTPFTPAAEDRTSDLSGISIDCDITRMEKRLQCGRMMQGNREMLRMVRQLNEKAVYMLDKLIALKESILKEVGDCRLFTLNYPLLIEHILREAKLYRATLKKLMGERDVCFKELQDTEEFWNRIMMEHALFIRGLLDPAEKELIGTADRFALEYKELLETAKRRDCHAGNMTMERSLEETQKLREFKEAGTKGLLDCNIRSIILPLLADHVLREANHYIRILENGYTWQGN